jgi:murein DD-endopeptidase MepM/ murein hydrolase activator NlpD
VRRLLAVALGAAVALPATSPPPDAGAAQRTIGDRTLERGDRGHDVRQLQFTLTRLKIRTRVDGTFGAATERQVRRYERRVRIAVDGRVSRGQARGMYRRRGLSLPRPRAATRAAPPRNGPGARAFPIAGSFRWGGSGAHFGERGGAHKGVDVFADCGTPLVAPEASRVVLVKQHDRAGHYLVLRGAESGEDHVLMHLQRRARVAKGARVAAGERVGEVGRTGNASACHLHFELWTASGWYAGGAARDPLPDLRAWAGVG